MCPDCKAKLDSSEFTEHDLRASRALHSIKQDYPLDDASFERARDFDSFYVIYTKTPSALIGKGGRVARRLDELMEKKVKIVDFGAEPEKQLNELFLPVRLRGVNKAYKNGEEVTRVRVFKRDVGRIPLPKETVVSLVKEYYGDNAELLLE